MRTYEEILSAMESKYEELSGACPQEASDIGIRLRLLAGEILSLENTLEWMERQSDPLTASGEYLDRLAAEKGLSRRGATKAKGQLKFSRGTALSYDLSIPAGTVCATEDNMWEYITTDDGVLAAGQLSLTVPAEAVVGGSDSNCAVGAVNVLVTAPEGVETVINEAAFSGGKAPESDAVLRERLILAYRLIPGGCNRSFYIRTAMEFEGVSSAGAENTGGGEVAVYIYCADREPDEALLEDIQMKFDEIRPINAPVMVYAAVKQTCGCSVRVKAKSGYDLEEAIADADRVIKNYYESLNVGDSFLTAKIFGAVMNCPSVESCAVDGVDIVGEQDTMIIPGTITVWELIE